jgi:UDP-galactopyranose mutase
LSNVNCGYDTQANEQNFHDYGPHVLHLPKNQLKIKLFIDWNKSNIMNDELFTIDNK